MKVYQEWYSNEKNFITSADGTMYNAREDTKQRRENTQSSAAFGDMNSNIISNEKNFITSADGTMYNARGDTKQRRENKQSSAAFGDMNSIIISNEKN